MDMIVDLRGNDNIMAMFLPLTESEKSAYMTRYSKPRKTNGVATKTIEPRSSVSNGAAQNGRASGLSRPGTVKLGTKKSIPRPGTFKVSKSIEGRPGGFSRSNSNFKSEPNLVSTESLLVALDAGVKSFNAKEILRATELIREKVRPSEIETYIISNLSTLIHSLISASLLSRQMFLNESDETSLIAVKIISRINASFLEICLKTPVGAIGKDDFEGILNEILETMAEDGIKAIEAGQNILQRLNVHVLKIVDAPPTHVSMVAGIRIMQRNLRSNGSEGVKNLAMRVLWRILNTFDKKSWDSEGNVEVLLQIYMFFEEFPQETWARLEDDKRVPYTSIKNCIVRLAKREGKKLVSSMNSVPQLKGTQLASYVSTVVSSMENEIG